MSQKLYPTTRGSENETSVVWNFDHPSSGGANIGVSERETFGADQYYAIDTLYIVPISYPQMAVWARGKTYELKVAPLRRSM